MKERLIGAVVLAALAVWLIPWLLDGPDEPIGDDRAALELPVPSGHVGDIRTEVIDLSPRREAGSASAAAGAPDSAAARSADDGGDVAATGASRAAAPPGATSSGGESRAATSSVPAAETPSADDAARTAASRPAETPASGSAEQASSAPAQPSTGAAPAAVRSASARQSAAAEASGDWAVQLGSFGEEENARRHADRISTFGYSPKISTFTAGGRVMYRVRVGPHATRQEAEAAASALTAHGFVAQVVTTK